MEKKDNKSADVGSTIRIAILASGAGSNAEKIIHYFNDNSSSRIKVVLVVSNKPDAGVLTIARQNNIQTLVINREQFFRGNGYTDELKLNKINLVVLAGFLWKIPSGLIKAFPAAIINIHPALLPKYGGKGMYGTLVHEAVILAGEKESGITIHYVDEVYDNGKIIFQASISISPEEDPSSLAKKIHALEHSHFSKVIEKLALEKYS